MELNEARRAAAAAGIGVEFVLREAWEVLLLAELVARASRPEWIFRGGTALRLAYGSPRYSLDLDFSTSAPLAPARFRAMVERWAGRHPEVRVADLWSKRFTHLADLRLQLPGYARPIGMKIEVSRRAPAPPRSSHEPRLIRSPHSPLECIVQVARLKRLYEEKRLALKQRRRPLDLYDVWYIGQRLKPRPPLPPHDFTPAELRRELHKYLPPAMHEVVSLLLRKR